MKRMAALLLMMSCGSSAWAQKKLKVYISADLEGIGGVATPADAVLGRGDNPAYEHSRKLMTLEVNAAIAGAFDAGATEVLVSDSHWEGRNLDPELLDVFLASLGDIKRIHEQYADRVTSGLPRQL